MRGLLIAAPASAQGKTTLTLGLLRALARRGVDVASAKSGPDYIDPAFHAAATGRPCATLDSWAAGPAQLRARAAAQPAALLIVEGAMGLYDGAVTRALPAPAGPPPLPCGGGPGPDVPQRAPVGPSVGTDSPRAAPRGAGGGSTAPCLAAPFPAAISAAISAAPGSAAALAAALGIPVVLVLDIARMGQGAAAVVHGLATFPGAPPIAGVLLNRAGSPRHAALAASAVEAVRPVLGVLPRRADLALPSRHLGLVQAAEHPDLAGFLERAADAVEAGCDPAAILAAAAPVAVPDRPPARLPPIGQRIAVARDSAFGFAYRHMLEDWRAQGAQILPFSPLADEAPDGAADAVFLPGGYPELHAGRLAAAGRFRAGMHAAAGNGATIYGECGGFMALGEGLVDAAGGRHAMLGLLRLETSIARPVRVLGYRRLEPLAGPWRAPVAGHEFHAAAATRADGAPLFRMRDAAGTDLGPAGLAVGRVSGSFAHIIEPETG
jgi:cobyrinic acid a,c-diamide synthase